MSTVRLTLILAMTLGLAGLVSTMASEPKVPSGTIFSINGRQAKVPATLKTTKRGASGRQVTLKDRLEKDLKARRPQEFAFIANVVALVDKGILSRRLVDGTYLWARNKRRHPFQYFQYALKVRARRRGIRL